MVNNISQTLKIDWAEVVDLLAREYGWTIDEINNLTFGQILTLIKTIGKRYRQQSEAIKDGKPTTEANEKSIRNLASKLGGKIKKGEDGKEEIVI